MIPADAVTAWGLTHAWRTAEQIEQDLLLSRAICEIANHPYLGDELVFRGGTAFHKLHLTEALRYSEDLDYVRSTAGGIGPVTKALTELGGDLGFTVRTKISAHPKVYWSTLAHNGIPIRIKIEVNTHERSPARCVVRSRFAVDSSWWTGEADVPVFDAIEMSATKLRALYQRKKGRDLFDLWLALSRLHLDADEIIAAFPPYRPAGYTAKVAAANLEAKRSDRAFRIDLDPLVTEWPVGYDVDAAAALVTNTVLAKIDAL
ncbi:nucleotidyl transferase AbiEii/AbiGii toxin family protein [Tessaracoccus caeni]|uniref:nucleotidyl transferase AbiEii/AbiGii toxin family protein n=1 Tax=Tessaracoccus caeni TaxID=3031239 RepID=UPI0023DB994B|nr:nucleotidyl transferase AbiEii/AbiGii toxin family protein [Tessaracoccus caeni]MDF1487944.1 nucleotidyl transferase AbiEii/AbiGii toxin family protein [Tessaracoccus caeni]